MEKVRSTSKIDAQIILMLSETEVRALLEITQYGVAAFLDVFYRHLGKCDLQDHEEGVKTLFQTIRTELPRHLKRIDDTRDVWNGIKIATPKTNKD